jgi:hypothetical protein
MLVLARPVQPASIEGAWIAIRLVNRGDVSRQHLQDRADQFILSQLRTEADAHRVDVVTWLMRDKSTDELGTLS